MMILSQAAAMSAENAFYVETAIINHQGGVSVVKVNVNKKVCTHTRGRMEKDNEEEI